jgi:hypothetical protein
MTSSSDFGINTAQILKEFYYGLNLVLNKNYNGEYINA